MKTTVLFALLLSLIATNTLAQYDIYQNKVWIFGRGAGIDFNSGSPVVRSSHINTTEAAASVCSPTGNLLFYTDGKIVYNRFDSVMPSGSSIVPYATISTAQGAVIAPVIGTTNKYYIFSIQQAEDTLGIYNKCRLSYSIVDMSLDGGKGDIEPSSMGIPLEDSLNESMITIKGDGNYIWLLVVKIYEYTFLAYKITSAGISAPVVSTLDTTGRPWYGNAMLKISHKKNKLIRTISKGQSLYDFNPATGVISNQIIIDTLPTFISGVEFSPDNSKVYFNIGGVGIAQYDLSVPTTAAMQASKYIVVPNISAFGHLRLAPNGRIYFRNALNDCLSCINSPNSSGAVCGYVLNTLNLLSSPGSYSSMPNLYWAQDDVTSFFDANESQAISLVSLSPNPATTELTITASEKITHLSISNMVGQEVYHHAYNSEMVKVDINTLPTGVYFVKVNGMAVRNFVKE